MTIPILETLTGKKLAVLIVLLVLCQIICFLIGGLIAPMPMSAEIILATKCLALPGETGKFYYSRGSGRCNEARYDDWMKYTDDEIDRYLVYTFQMPLPKNYKILQYSRWQQYLIGILEFDVVYPDVQMANHIHTQLTLDSKLGYRNKDDAENQWKMYASSVETRTLQCNISNPKSGHTYDCLTVPLFELFSLHYDYYLLNVRLPFDENRTIDIGHIEDLWLVTINQNTDFTKMWLSMKTIFFLCVLGIIIWFWKRVQVFRKPALLEYMLFWLGSAVSLLNIPIEYLTILFDMSFMLLLEDIRQGLFYGVLLSFWLVFAGEHFIISDNKNTLKTYWKHLSLVAIGCFPIFILNIYQHCVLVKNLFHLIWVADLGMNLSFVVIILSGVLAGIYFLFLTYTTVKMFRNISNYVKYTDTKHTVLCIPTANHRNYGAAIYRYKFLMLVTLVYAAVAVISVVLGQVSEGCWIGVEDIYLKMKSVFLVGVYGMLNVYIFGFMILYAPSCQQ